METFLVVSSVLLWVVVLCNLLLTLVLVRRINANRPQTLNRPDVGLKAGETAPDFTAQMLTGESVNLFTYLGRTTTFLFVSPHCNACHKVLPEAAALAPKAAQSNTEFILVCNGDLEEARSFAREGGVQFPVIIPSNNFLESYKVTVLPSYCLINEQGIVQSAGHLSQEIGEWKTLTTLWNKNGEVVSSQGRR